MKRQAAATAFRYATLVDLRGWRDRAGEVMLQ